LTVNIVSLLLLHFTVVYYTLYATTNNYFEFKEILLLNHKIIVVEIRDILF